MRGKSVFALALSVFAALCGTPSDVVASFDGGAERFDGVTLDSATWATSIGNPTPTFTQNGALTIGAFDTDSIDGYVMGAYTTKSAVVPVGGSVWAEVRVDGAGQLSDPTHAEMILTLDPSGSERSATDSAQLMIYTLYSPSFNGIHCGETVKVDNLETGFGGPAVSADSQPLGTTFIWQIERLSASETRFSLFSEAGPASVPGTPIALVASDTRSSVTTSADMYVMLEVIGTDTTFDNVTINRAIAQDQTVIPEPAALSALVIPAGLTLLRRRASR